jgi:hypothetical protein
MRVAFVLLVAGVAILMSGCSGFGKGHSGRGAYFDAIEAILDRASPTPIPPGIETAARRTPEVDALAPRRP